ncbi:MAG: TerB N-terminal domain-containing protein [Flavobacteriaceae bacterium]|nr:TerB N-terminal domain-containing protein [Flavobacteriaceae bacterium]
MDEQRYTYQGDFNIDDTYLQKIRISKALLEPNDARWIKKSQKITIGNLEISGGYFYLGTKMLNLTLTDQDPSLINPDLKIRLLKKGSLKDHGYYPIINYKYFTLTEKGNYLKWLASDRTETDIHHAFIEFYFMGIERRILVDARLELVSDDEYVELFQELQRLLTAYNNVYPYLLNHIKMLMEVMAILRPNLLPINYLLNHPTSDSILVNCILTVEHKKNIPLTPELALAHYVSTNTKSLPPRFDRCMDKIHQRFIQVFKKFHPNGLKLKPARWNLIGHYSPLNKGIENSKAGYAAKDWKVKDFSNRFYDHYKMIEECKKDVEPYAEYLKLQSSLKSDALATLLMPRGLHDPKAIEIIKNFYGWANAKFREKGPFVTDFSELWRFTRLEPIEKLLKREQKNLHLLSYHSGIVIIPHHSNYASKLKIDGKVGLFFDEEMATWELSSIHQIMEVTIYGCILIARTGNKEVTTKQINFIEGIIEDNIFLSKLEKKSLNTFLLWQLASPSSSRLHNPFLDNCDDILQLAIKSLLIEMAELSGNIGYSIMNVLRKLFRMFKMEKQFLKTIPKTIPSKPSLWKSIFSSAVDKVGSPSDGLTFASWVRPGQKVVHRNIEITGGFFYHGDILVAYNQFKQDVSLISERSLNYSLSSLYYSSNYKRSPHWHDLYPNDWADKYLRWLGSDRSDPDIKLDYLILYIGGLERRIIIDSVRGG